MCEFCENFDFGQVRIILEKFRIEGNNITHANLGFAGGSGRFPIEEQFKYCPECGRRLRNENNYQ